jgi:hypothetical protein
MTVLEDIGRGNLNKGIDCLLELPEGTQSALPISYFTK